MLEAEVSLDGQGKPRARDWEWTGVSAGKACAPEWGSSGRGSPHSGEHLFILGHWLIRWGPPRGGGPSAFLRYLQWVSSKGSLTDAPRTTPGQASAHCRTPSGGRVRYTLIGFNNVKQTEICCCTLRGFLYSNKRGINLQSHIHMFKCILVGKA